MADPLAMGFTLPDGQDYMKFGDDAIRKNAQAAADMIEKTSYRRKNIEAGSSIYDLEGAGKDGVWSCLLASTAATVTGLPQEIVDNPTPFHATVKTLTNTVTIEIDTVSVYGGMKFTANSSPSTGNGWTAWKRLLTKDDIPAQSAQERGYKTVPLALTMPASSSTVETISAATLRYPLRYSVPLPRWRFHLQNINDRGERTYPGVVSFTGLWAGPGSHSTGAFSGTPVKVMNAFRTPADGSEYIGPWISNAPIMAATDWLVSTGFSNAAGQENTLSAAGVFRSTNAADASVANPSLTRSVQSPFSIWIEVEVPAETPVVATVASSSGAGVGSTLPMLQSPLSLLCQRIGALPIHYAHPGSTLSIWKDATQHKWHKWDPYARPSSVIFDLGSNDAFGTEPIDVMKADSVQVMAIVREKVSTNIYAATLHPRTSGDETKRREWNAYLRTLPLGIRDLFDWSAAVSTDDETIIPAYNFDGIHTTTAGAQAKANATTRPVTAPDPASVTAETNERIDSLESRSWIQVTGPSDLNDVLTSGPFRFGTRPQNTPTSEDGTLESIVSGSVVLHRWTTFGLKPVTYKRRRINGVWSGWEPEYAPALIGRGILAAGASLRSLCLPEHNGDWALSGPNWRSYLDLPPGVPADSRGTVKVVSPNNWTVTHEVHINTGTIYWLRTLLSPTGPTFNPWQVIDTSLIVPQAPAPATIPALPTDDWIHHGDSLTALSTWVTQLRDLTGKNHINEGWSGQLAAQIAARQGGNPALMTVLGGSIPASGTAVKVTAATPFISMPVGTQQPTRQVPGSLAGRTGYLYDGGQDTEDGYFMPTSGNATSATGTQVFRPTGNADIGRQRIATIWIGENDIFANGQSPQEVAYMARQIHDYQSTSVKRALVLSIPRRAGNGIPTGSGQKTQEINDALRAEFPSQFVDIAAYLMSPLAATNAGINYTTDDLADISDGVTPRVFRLPGDSVHFNELGSKIIAPFIYAEARRRGWL